MSATPDDSRDSNPLAEQPRKRYGDQLADILFRCNCLSVGPSGKTGDRIASNDECRSVRVELDAGFYIDVTGDIAQQTTDGLLFVIGNLEAEVNRLEGDIAAGKFPVQV